MMERHRRFTAWQRALQEAIAAKAYAWRDVIKIGRTHLEDAVPLTVGQEWSGYARQLTQALVRRDQMSARPTSPETADMPAKIVCAPGSRRPAGPVANVSRW